MGGIFRFLKMSTLALTKDVKWKKAWLKEDSKAYATLVGILKKKSLLNRKESVNIISPAQLILQDFICCTIITVLRGYILVIMEWLQSYN